MPDSDGAWSPLLAHDENSPESPARASKADGSSRSGSSGAWSRRPGRRAPTMTLVSVLRAPRVRPLAIAIDGPGSRTYQRKRHETCDVEKISFVSGRSELGPSVGEAQQLDRA